MSAFALLCSDHHLLPSSLNLSLSLSVAFPLLTLLGKGMPCLTGEGQSRDRFPYVSCPVAR